MPARDDAREEIPLLIADLFEAAGAMRRHGDRIAAQSGQTQARWQLLSVASAGDWTVPRIAHRLGISRQAVQRVADELRDEGLLTAEPNPYHQRSLLIRLTPEGRQALAAITAQAQRWHRRLARVLDGADVATTRRVLRALVDGAD
ncbi:MarR family winged helix-turn-helix transcriptional regulator [Conexibacter sp. CPCC 206217]|uniref:MarR family winged helix-turn-helix transcriptional regulator n=1 Tax=Conexibacter sp. CPCC 206217 TaxID=3064574 RepID=UPI00271BA318|nr:MarR family winged helix-turn-helix transcriptional regulator [Conexibacter sp. CPCC 206217]MDO8212155.1 MarR family winged helix-turn-helix transcriptional regulator [Conexibacter sp. CPCC 206217]